MSDGIPFTNGIRLDELVTKLLDDPKVKGIILGEEHLSPAMKEGMMEMLPGAKTRGVKLVGIEYRDWMVDAALAAPTREDFAAQYPAVDFIFDDLYSKAKELQKSGAKVFGCQMDFAKTVETAFKDPNIDREKLEEIQKLYRLEALRSLDDSHMILRDNYAIKKIQQEQEKAGGKVFVLIGKEHTGTRTAYKGIDVRLGYPSIDFVRQDDSTGAIKAGTVRSTTGTTSTYEAILPETLAESGLTFNIAHKPDTNLPPLPHNPVNSQRKGSRR